MTREGALLTPFCFGRGLLVLPQTSLLSPPEDHPPIFFLCLSSPRSVGPIRPRSSSPRRAPSFSHPNLHQPPFFLPSPTSSSPRLLSFKHSTDVHQKRSLQVRGCSPRGSCLLSWIRPRYRRRAQARSSYRREVGSILALKLSPALLLSLLRRS